MKRNLFFNILTLILLSAVFVGCDNKSTDAVKINNEIDTATRRQLGELNRKLFNSIMLTDTKSVEALASEQFLKKAGGKLDKLVQSTARTFSTPKFEVIDEFYSKHPVKADLDTLLTKKGNADDYMIAYKATNEEMYTSVLVTKNLFINCMILVVYGKYGNDWKINVLQIGEFEIDGKTTQDYYRDAIKFFDAGQVIDASNTLGITAQLASPAGEFFKYRNEDIMREFHTKVMDTANDIYKFPVVVKDVKTGPVVFSVSPKYVTDPERKGVFPLIKYVTKIDLDNVAALKAENAAIQKAIGGLFLGIDKNNKYIFYQAVNATAAGVTSVRNYGFVQQTTKN